MKPRKNRSPGCVYHRQGSLYRSTRRWFPLALSLHTTVQRQVTVCTKITLVAAHSGHRMIGFDLFSGTYIIDRGVSVHIRPPHWPSG